MQKYVIEREIPGAGRMTEEELREVAMRSVSVLKTLPPNIQWLHSFVTDDKVYCVYLAPDEELIREHARKAGVPADRISAVRRLLDSNGPHAAMEPTKA
jgi:Nickel responsive protein SCO4226-like